MNVKCMETGKIYASTAHAADVMGLDMSAIGYCVRGKRKATHGYHFKRTNELVTEKRMCGCGAWFMPKGHRDFICRECRKAKLRPAIKKEKHEQYYSGPFFEDTYVMMVADAERGRGMERIAAAENRDHMAVVEELERIRHNGIYDGIRRRMGDEAPRKISFVRIA